MTQLLPDISLKEGIMKNPLDSITGTIVSGLVLVIVLYYFTRHFLVIAG
jgi:hypothetical protein